MMTTYSLTDWGEGPLKLTWHDRVENLDPTLVTSAHGYCFHNGKLLVTKNAKRGFEIPGGHREASETLARKFHQTLSAEGNLPKQFFQSSAKP